MYMHATSFGKKQQQKGLNAMNHELNDDDDVKQTEQKIIFYLELQRSRDREWRMRFPCAF